MILRKFKRIVMMNNKNVCRFYYAIFFIRCCLPAVLLIWSFCKWFLLHLLLLLLLWLQFLLLLPNYKVWKRFKHFINIYTNLNPLFVIERSPKHHYFVRLESIFWHFGVNLILSKKKKTNEWGNSKILWFKFKSFWAILIVSNLDNVL